MKYLTLLLLILMGCETDSKNKIIEQRAEIERLKEENRKLSAQVYYNSAQTNNYNQPLPTNQGSNSSYLLTDNNTLVEEFKNYMGDEYFTINSFKLSGKIIKVECPVVSNVSIRRLERDNPTIFSELLSRFDKIVFYDDFGGSYTLKKK